MIQHLGKPEFQASLVYRVSSRTAKATEKPSQGRDKKGYLNNGDLRDQSSLRIYLHGEVWWHKHLIPTLPEGDGSL